MLPFESTATPDTSPKFIPCGSLKKSGTESKGRSGTFCCANAGATNKNKANMKRFIETSWFPANLIQYWYAKNIDCRRANGSRCRPARCRHGTVRAALCGPQPET